MKCEGVCERNMHAKCVGITKTMLKAYNELDNMYYICDKCVGNSMMAINKKLDKVMSIFHIYDERVTRYDKDMKELMNNVCELKISMENDKVKVTVDSGVPDKSNLNKNVESNFIPSNVKKSKNTKSDAVILIKPKKIQNCEETEKDVKKNIDPKCVKVNKMCKGPKGGIAIVCDTDEASKQLEKIATEKLSQDYIVQSTIARSKLKVIGIAKGLSDDEIVSAMKNQNDFLSESNIKLIHSYVVKKSNSISVIIEIERDAAKLCLKFGRLNIMWSKCRVFEKFNLFSCYKCKGYNHKASECKNDRACKNCANNHGENPAAMQHTNSARWTPITLVVFLLTLIVLAIIICGDYNSFE